MPHVASIPGRSLLAWIRQPASAASRRVHPGCRRPARPWLLEPLEGRALLATFTITNLGDAGAGSLREAIAQANALAGPDTITFDPSVRGTIELLSALPELASDITLEGPGAEALTVARSSAQGTPTFRIFTVPAGAEIAISGLTISGGRAPIEVTPGGSTSSGGGILNRGILTVTASTLTGNSAAGGGPPSFSGSGSGGGIANSGTLTVIASTLAGNSASGAGFGRGFGGGIDNSGTLTVTASTLSGNSVTSGRSSPPAGGGISNGGMATVTASTFSGNSAEIGGGGGISNGGTLTVTASTLAGNSAAGGGGISSGGTLTVIASTLAGNSAGDGGGISSGGTLTVIASTLSGNSAGSFGGGIFNTAFSTLTLTNSTLSGNSARSSGGGISNFGGGVTVTASTLSGNSAITGGGIDNPSFPEAGFTGTLTVLSSLFANGPGGNLANTDGAVTSLGHNLFTDAPAVTLDPTDLINTDPLLAPLGDYGGPTATHALLPGSPAIDAGVLVPGVTTDQRGVPRPQGPAPDIGAFEARPDEVDVGPAVVSLHRLGFHHRPARLVLAFSAPLDPARAQDPANYRLTAVGPHHARPIPFRAATYDDAGPTVTLLPARRLAPQGIYRLEVNARPPGGLASPAGVPLDGDGDGQPGGDFVTSFVGRPGPVQHRPAVPLWPRAPWAALATRRVLS